MMMEEYMARMRPIENGYDDGDKLLKIGIVTIDVKRVYDCRTIDSMDQSKTDQTNVTCFSNKSHSFLEIRNNRNGKNRIHILPHLILILNLK